MESGFLFLLAADLLLLSHVLFVVFVIFGLVLILVGKIADWDWVRNRRFRVAHLAAIGIVVVQSWLGITCPLTTLEMWFRDCAGDLVYPGTVISH